MIRNYGALLERSVRRSGFGISKLARRLNVSRQTVYQWFREQNLEAVTILRIENTIGANSVAALEEIYGFSVQSLEPELDAYTLPNAEEVEVGYWMERYIGLLEKYNSVLMKKKNKKNGPGSGEYPMLRRSFLYHHVWSVLRLVFLLL